MNNFVKKNMSKNNLELHYWKSLPGAGKTTQAKKMLENSPGKFKMITKDDLRDLLDNGEWSKQNETFVVKMQDMIIEQALENGFSVLVPDTNLHSKHETRFRDIARKYSAKVVLHDLTDVSVDECIARDLKRLRSVGEQVIRKMYRDFLEPPKLIREDLPGIPHCVIFDVDGTLAHMDNGKPGYRRPFEWHRVNEDIPDRAVVDLAISYRLANPDVKIVIMSGRSDECRGLTEQWLVDNGVPFDELHMRKGSDSRKDTIVKEELFMKMINGKYNVNWVADDRNSVVAMWRDILGLKVFHVADGNF